MKLESGTLETTHISLQIQSQSLPHLSLSHWNMKMPVATDCPWHKYSVLAVDGVAVTKYLTVQLKRGKTFRSLFPMIPFILTEVQQSRAVHVMVVRKQRMGNPGIPRPFPHTVSTRMAQHLVKVDLAHTRKLCQGRRQWLRLLCKVVYLLPDSNAFIFFLKRTLALFLHNQKTITIFFLFPKNKN